MRTERRELLEALMARLPADAAAEVALFEAFGEEVRATLVVLARELGMPPIAEEDLDGLAFDACGVLATVARWWSADGGALPWVYGRDRLLGLLRAWRGPATAPLPEGDLAAEAVTVPADDGRPALAVLDQLVRDGAHPVVLRFRDALAAVAPRDGELVLLYAQQQAAGDPSPSHTVGAMLERSPAAVRQAVSRTRRRLRQLALTEPDYRPLLALPLLAGGRAA